MLQKTKMTFLRLFAIIGFVVLFAIASISLASCSSEESKTATGMSINSNGELVVTYSDGSEESLGTVVGEDGETGATGETGETGAKGDTGATGTGISNITVSGDDLVITYSDNSTTSIDISALINAGSSGTTTDSCSHTSEGKETWECVWELNPPTCYGTGVGLYYCTLCKEVKVDIIEANGSHTWVEKVVAPTCTSEGYSYKYCSVCEAQKIETIAYVASDGTVLEDQTGATSTNTKYAIKDKVSHDYKYTVDTSVAQPETYDAATETYTYSLKVTCGYDCDTVFENVTATVKASDFDTTTAAASCTEAGKATATLKYGDVTVGTVSLTIPAKGHTVSDTPVVEAVAATCIDGNAALYLCSDCGEYLIKVDANGNYTYTTETVDDKTVVTETGDRWAITKVETTTYNEEKVSYNSAILDYIANGGIQVAAVESHKWVEDTNSKVVFGPTGDKNECMYGSVTYWTCSVCKSDKAVTTEGAGYHTVDEWTVSLTPTTSAAGTLTGTCTVCEKDVSIEIPAITSTGWTTTDKASCSGNADMTYTYTVSAGATFTTLEDAANSSLSKRTVVAGKAWSKSYVITVGATGHLYNGVPVEGLKEDAYINLQKTSGGTEAIGSTKITYITLSDLSGLTLTSVETGKVACSTEGYYQNAVFYCESCNSYIGVHVRTDHNTNSWAKLSEATDYETRKDDDHTYTAATCGATGTDWYYCTDCNAFIESITEAATGNHTYTYTLTDGATQPSAYDATATSYTYYVTATCSVCAGTVSLTPTIAAADLDITTVAATCDVDGKAYGTLYVGTTKVADVTLTIPATGHYLTVYTLVDGVVTESKVKLITDSSVAAIYIADDDDYYYAYYKIGVETTDIYKYVKTTGNGDTTLYPAYDSSYNLIISVGVTNKPCASGVYGSAMLTCANENSLITITNIKAEHDYSNTLTVDSTNKWVYTSSMDAVTNTKTTEINGETYTYKYYVIDPTCTEGGYTIVSCSVCGDVTKINPTEKTGHKYGDVEVTITDSSAETIIVSLTCTVTDCMATDSLTLTIPTTGWVNDGKGYQLDTSNQVFDVYKVTENGITWTRTTYYADEDNVAKIVYTIEDATIEGDTIGTITATYTGNDKDANIVVYVVNETIYLLDKTYVYTASATDNTVAELGGVVATAKDSNRPSCSSITGVAATVDYTYAVSGTHSENIEIQVKSAHTYVDLDATNYATYSSKITDAENYAPAAATCTTDEVLYQYCTVCGDLVRYKSGIDTATGHNYVLDTTKGTDNSGISYDGSSAYTIYVICEDCNLKYEWTVTETTDFDTADYSVTPATCVKEAIYTIVYTYDYTTSYTNASGNTATVDGSLDIPLTKGGDAKKGTNHTAASYDLLGNPVTYTYTYGIDGTYYEVEAYICTVCKNEVVVSEDKLDEYNLKTLTVGEASKVTLYSDGNTTVTVDVEIKEDGIYTLSIANYLANSGDSDLIYAYIYDYESYAYYADVHQIDSYDWDTDTYTYTAKTAYIMNMDVEFGVPMYLKAGTTLTIYFEFVDDTATSASINVTVAKDSTYATVEEWVEATYGITAVTLDSDNSFVADGSTVYTFTATADGMYTFSTSDGDVYVYTDLSKGSVGEAYYSRWTSDEVKLVLSAGDVVYLTNNTNKYNGVDASTVAIEYSAIAGAITLNVEQDIDGTDVYTFTATDGGDYLFTVSSGEVYVVGDSVNTSVSDKEIITLAAGETVYIYNTEDWYGDPIDSTITITAYEPLAITYTAFTGEVYNISDYSGSSAAAETKINDVLTVSTGSATLSIDSDLESGTDLALANTSGLNVYEGVSLDSAISVTSTSSSGTTYSLTFTLSADSDVTFYYGLTNSYTVFTLTDSTGEKVYTYSSSTATSSYTVLSSTVSLSKGTYTITNGATTSYNYMRLYSIAVGTATAGGGTESPTTPATVESVTVAANVTTLAVGASDTLTLEVKMSDSSSYSGTVTWTSSDATVATVDENGKVTAVGVGTVTIYATADSVKSNEVTLTITGISKTISITDYVTANVTYDEDYTNSSGTTYSNSQKTYTSNVTLYTGTDGTSVVVTADSSHEIVFDKNGSKTVDNLTLTDRVKLGGKASSTSRSVEITVVGLCTVTVYMCSSSSSTERTVNLYNSTDTENAVDTKTVGGTLTSYTFTISEAGTYWFGSADSGLNVYYISIAY